MDPVRKLLTGVQRAPRRSSFLFVSPETGGILGRGVGGRGVLRLVTLHDQVWTVQVRVAVQVRVTGMDFWKRLRPKGRMKSEVFRSSATKGPPVSSSLCSD